MPSGLAGAGPLPVSAGLRQEWHAQAQARPLRAGVLALAWNAPEAADRAPRALARPALHPRPARPGTVRLG